MSCPPFQWSFIHHNVKEFRTRELYEFIVVYSTWTQSVDSFIETSSVNWCGRGCDKCEYGLLQYQYLIGEVVVLFYISGIDHHCINYLSLIKVTELVSSVVDLGFDKAENKNCFMRLNPLHIIIRQIINRF